ncbi:hypothetical protein Bbelb_393610 [Branchiostoma belcheri]|nr:hypothetical protein Bbelb_393610 [Branchiostoma belcheri]
MLQISTTDNPVEAIPHMVVNDRSFLDFYLFPKLKFHLRGQRFDGNDDVISAIEPYLGVPDATFFHKGKTKLEHHWTKDGMVNASVEKAGVLGFPVSLKRQG